MSSAVPPLSLGVDPLTAEAKRRIRRRRMLLAATVVIVAAVAVTLTVRSWTSGSMSAPVRPVFLHHAVTRGTLVAVNRETDVAEFRISCGWYISKGGSATAKVRPGIYSVSLRGAYINVEAGVDPAVPGSGAANHVSLASWERWTRPGWKAWLSSGSTKSYLSDGPSTDICHGVIG
jgi:hypothetical protein